MKYKCETWASTWDSQSGKGYENKLTGFFVGLAVGRLLGLAVGRLLGLAVGRLLGLAVGRLLGLAVGGWVYSHVLWSRERDTKLQRFKDGGGGGDENTLDISNENKLTGLFVGLPVGSAVGRLLGLAVGVTVYLQGVKLNSETLKHDIRRQGEVWQLTHWAVRWTRSRLLSLLSYSSTR